MSMLEAVAGEVEDPGEGSSAESDGGGDQGEGLVLPEEVVAELAGRLAERARSGGPVALTGPEGLLSGIIGQVLQAGLAAELDAHLDDGGEGNRRNGAGVKTLNTEVGPVRIAVPRDRAGTFSPVLVPKQATRSDGLNAVITSLYAKGMSVRDIARHVRQTAGVDLSHDTVSRVTDAALEGMREWQHRPLEPFYPVVYVDALVAKVRDGAAVRNKAVNIAVGIDADGCKRVLGIWVAPGEGAKTWAQALAQLRNRGLEEVLFVCCDGLNGLPDAITATWPEATVQTCVIHLIRSSMKYVSWKERKKAAAAMRPIYTALNEAAARAALENLRRDFGKKSPGMVAAWERAWDNFVPFLVFDSAIRKVIYTTNAIESVNFQLRKITKNRGHFPTDEAAVKLLYLGIRNITGRHIDGDGLVLQRGERGTGTYGWKAAMNAFAVAFPDRVPA
jgi:putative transposase